METFDTKYGKITLYSNDVYIISPFRNNDYWDINTLFQLKKHINPEKNILEIGGHCGTSSIIYASFINDNCKVYVYEPQKKMYDLLCHNIKQNNLEHKIIPYNFAVFCTNGKGSMNEIDLDGGGGNVEKRYEEESNLPCNFGGVCLGSFGEEIQMITMDDMKHENVGFIHVDAQGAENFIFSHGKNFIKNNRPVILYENNARYQNYLYQQVCKSYPQYKEYSTFSIQDYCFYELGYKYLVYNFMNGADDLLLPN